MDSIERDALDVMVSGGKGICDQAIDKWWQGKYGTDAAMQQKSIARWKAVRAAIGDLADRLKEPR
jgi:hypothetical protein